MLSLETVKKYVGCEIHMICDSKSISLYNDFGYDKVSNELEEISEINSLFWSYGKIKSLSLYDSPVLHVDTDVAFLNYHINSVLNENWDILVQMKEAGFLWKKHYGPMLQKFPQKINDLDLSFYNFSYNCGILGFKDNEIKNKYVSEYFRLINSFEMNIRLAREIAEKGEINLILEQSLLCLISQNSNSHVKELIRNEELEKDLEKSAVEKGFLHLWGKSKYNNENVTKVKNKLRKDFPEAYSRTEKILKNM